MLTANQRKNIKMLWVYVGCASLLYFVVFFSLTSQAAEYRLQPSISLMTETDDNVRLSANDIDIYSLQGESAILNADFSRSQTNRSLSINNRFASRKYDLNRYNSEDFSTTLNYQRGFERSSYSLNLSASDESIRSLDNQPGNDGATVQRANKAQSYSLSLTGQYQLTEQHRLQNQFSAQQRHYDNEERSNYNYFSNNFLWVNAINPQLSMQVNLSLSSFRPEKTNGIEYAFIETAIEDYGLSNATIISRMEDCFDRLNPLDPYNPDTALVLPAPIPNFDSTEINCFNAKSFSLAQDTINLQVGLQYQWTENLRLDLLIGSSHSETERDVFSLNAILVTGELTGNFVQETEQKNLSYNVDVNYQHSAVVSSSLKASQSQEQTAYGSSVDTRRITLSNAWRINQLNTLKFSLFQRERSQSLTNTDRELYNRNYTQLHITHVKYWPNNIRSDFRYFHSISDNGAQQNGKRNRWILSLTWQPEATIWSK